MAAVPTLRGFLKLYASVGASKLAGFLDEGEEEMVQRLMAVKAGSRCVGRVGGVGGEGGQGGGGGSLLDGEMMATSDLDFVIDDVRSFSPSFPLPPSP